MKANGSKMQILQGIISSIFAFLLTLFFIFLFLLTGLAFGLFSDRIILSKVNESNYYNEVHRELNESAEFVVTEAGLPITVLNDVISLERVYIGGKYYIEDTLAGKEPSIRTEKIREQLMQNINLYLDQEEITQTEELSTGINEIISRVEQEYKRGVQFQFISYLSEYKTLFYDVVIYALPAVIVLALLLSYLLIRIHVYKHQGVRYITYSVIASTSIILISAATLLLTGIYNQVEQLPLYYDRFLTGYFRWGIQVFVYLGGLGVLASVLLIMLIGYLKRNVI